MNKFHSLQSLVPILQREEQSEDQMHGTRQQNNNFIFRDVRYRGEPISTRTNLATIDTSSSVVTILSVAPNHTDFQY